MVGGEAQWRRGPCPWLGARRSYYLLCPPGMGARLNLYVAEAEEKREFGSNSEELK